MESAFGIVHGPFAMTQALVQPCASRAMPLVKTDVIDGAVVLRLREALRGVMARRGEREVVAASVVRHLAGVSTSVRRLLAEAAGELSSRGSFDRPVMHAALYASNLLGASGEMITLAALASENAPWSAFVAASQSSATAVCQAVSRLSARTQGHLGFGAAFVRSLTGDDAAGKRATELAVMLKEAHRVRWIDEFAMPVLARNVLPSRSVARTLEALRGVERHLGRWLRLGELELACGGESVADGCRRGREASSVPSRHVWSWIEWLLSRGACRASAPPRLSRDVINKLSDRPSASRDLSFLHRVGDLGVAPAADPLAIVGRSGKSPDAVRALLTLVTRYGRTDRIERLRTIAARGTDAARGVAAAALWDLGDRNAALELVDELVISKSLANVGWGALIRVAHLTGDGHPIVSETAVRRLCEARVY